MRFLIDERSSDWQVVGYGAAAKGNTLLNYAGVSTDLLNFIADKAVSKQGKFTPGSHIPIVSPETLKKHDCDTVLVFPWNIIDELKEELEGFKLLTAVPKLKMWT